MTNPALTTITIQLGLRGSLGLSIIIVGCIVSPMFLSRGAVKRKLIKEDPRNMCHEYNDNAGRGWNDLMYRGRSFLAAGNSFTSEIKSGPSDA